MQQTLWDAAGPPRKSEAISSQDRFGASWEVLPLLLTQMVLLTLGGDSCEDSLVVNLWLAKSIILYLSVKFTHVHSINTWLTSRRAWTPHIYQASCRTPCMQMAEFSRHPSKHYFLGGKLGRAKPNESKSRWPSHWWHPWHHPQPKQSPLGCGRRTWARVPSLSSPLWQTEERVTTRGSFSRN